MSTDNFGALGADFFIKTFDLGASMSQVDLDALVQYVQLTTTIMAIGEFTPDVQQSVWMILERVDVPSAPGYTVTNNTEVTMTSGGLVTIDSMPWTKITGKPSFFSGAYADLTGKPTIPTSFSSLVNSENTFSLDGAGVLTFPNGTTSEGNSITIPVDESLTVNLSTGMPLELNSTFKINPESIKLPTGNGIIYAGEETAADKWGLDSGNKTLYFPDAGDGVLPRISYSTYNNIGMELKTYAKGVRISTQDGSNESNWTFGATGDLTLPAGGDIVDSTGTSVLGGGGSTLPANASGYLTNDGSGNLAWAAGDGTFSGAYADLTGKPTIPTDVSDLTDTTGLLGDGSDPAYKGFKAHYGTMYDNTEDESGPINKLVIYKSTATPASAIDADTSSDDFQVTGLTGSDVVAMLVVVTDGTDWDVQTPSATLKTFVETIIDEVILTGGVEGDIRSVADMKTAFYANFSNFNTVIPDVKADLEFFAVNNQFAISPAFETGKGATFTGLSYNMSNDTLDAGSWGQGAGTHQAGDVFVIPGNTIQDADSNFLATPANDVTITITTAPDGFIGTFTVTGTLPRPTETWPNSISDGGDDEYDGGNAIHTDLAAGISYNSGDVVTSSEAFGGGDYVVTYQAGIFGVFAIDTAIDSIGTSGDNGGYGNDSSSSGFDGDGIAVTGSLYGAVAVAVVDYNDLTNKPTLTLDSVTDSGSVTTNGITVGSVTLTNGAVLKDTEYNAVTFGFAAGQTNQGSAAVAVGPYAGQTNQGSAAVAVGSNAGSNGQGVEAVAVGGGAGALSQSESAVAVGVVAGGENQGVKAVAVGYYAGSWNQGANAVAIGASAGRVDQGANSIIINATGAELNQGTANTFTVAPIRNASGTSGVLQYNTSTKEVSYSNEITVKTTTVTGIISSTSDWSGVDLTELATTDGTGAGLTVTVTEVAGVATAITILNAGNGYTDGDTITVTSGGAIATFTINVLAPQWTFGTDGSLTLPEGGTIDNTPVIVTVTLDQFNDGGFTGTQVFTRVSNILYQVLPSGPTMELVSGTWRLKVSTSTYYDSTDLINWGNVAGSSPAPVGTLTTLATMKLTVDSNVWQFDEDGKLTFPSGMFIESAMGNALISADPNVIIAIETSGPTSAAVLAWIDTDPVTEYQKAVSFSTNNGDGSPYAEISVLNHALSGSAQEWRFNDNGSLTFPDASVQTKAWAGIPGPYADDAAAATAGVAVNYPYHKTGTGGQVFVRLT